MPSITPIKQGVAVGKDAFMCLMRNRFRYESRQNLGKENWTEKPVAVWFGKALPYRFAGLRNCSLALQKNIVTRQVLMNSKIVHFPLRQIKVVLSQRSLAI